MSEGHLLEDWSEFSFATKLNILEGESTVDASLLLGCKALLYALRLGCGKKQALEIINEQF